jgi:sugar (pentulose or hexulose) kinase
MTQVRGYLGIDAGTQGLSVLFCDEKLAVIASGDGSYDMVPGLPEGDYEQQPTDWERALSDAMGDLRRKLSTKAIEMDVLAIGISGQMHGEVLFAEGQRPLIPARLWCDSRNEDEQHELTDVFGVKAPKRMTITRWLWTIRNRAETAREVAGITTPAGWLQLRLTGKHVLGIGDASGMFPISQETLDYDAALLEQFDAGYSRPANVKPAGALLPAVLRAGDVAGTTNAQGAALLGLPEGIPVAPAEGDQPAALAGSLIAGAGTVSMSFGTSIVTNIIGDRPFKGVHPAVDHFCAVDGHPINMVFQRNGTTFFNAAVGMFQPARGDETVGDTFGALMPQVLQAAPDCGGILALPFMDDEPGLEVTRGGRALFIGINGDNARPGNFIKSALLASAFNLRKGLEAVREQGFALNQIVLSGGLTKTPELSEVLANVFQAPVLLLASAEEGTAWGAALLASYTYLREQKQAPEAWGEYLDTLRRPPAHEFKPTPEAVDAYNASYGRHLKLLQTQGELEL